MANILIVEDEAAVAELIAVNLKYAGFEYRLAPDAVTARAEVAARLPELVLLDWMLPGESGLSLAKAWRAEKRARFLPIILLTARGGDDDIVKGLDAGADDYMVKPFSPQEMLARIRALLRRKAPDAAGEDVSVGCLTLSPANRTVIWRGQIVRMGNPEFKLLNYFLTHPDRIHTREKLLDKVWGDHVFIEERTIDVHIKRLRAALAPCGFIETVRGAGYRFTSEKIQNG